MEISAIAHHIGNFDFSRPEYPGEKIRYHVTASSNQVPLPRSRESRINTPVRRWTRSQRGEKGASAVIILTQAQVKKDKSAQCTMRRNLRLLYPGSRTHRN